jgi:8-oxo-dGTP pyrophosphatase MutT (NUDIX family)
VPNWRRRDAERLQRCGIFALDRVRFEPPEGGEPRPFHVLDMPEWINVIALTDDGQVPMVRQYRYGTESLTLEIPGGMCDPGEDPLEAARRELKEETGYESDDWSPLGWVHPNPSIQNNRCHTFLARGAKKTSEPDPDPNERIVQELVPLDEIADRIAGGEITHALVIAAFRFYEQTKG